MKHRYSFEKLNVWNDSRELVKQVYKISDKFPPKEKYALCTQIQRAVISIPSNIAEGMGRLSEKEQIRFLEIAYGSTLEVYCQLVLAADLEYINLNDIEDELSLLYKVSNRINALSKTIQDRIA